MTIRVSGADALTTTTVQVAKNLKNEVFELLANGHKPRTLATAEPALLDAAKTIAATVNVRVGGEPPRNDVKKWYDTQKKEFCQLVPVKPT